ncbi:MAG: amino acid adenylation domain-containing protein, partial [Chitinophagaceae bacterium]
MDRKIAVIGMAGRFPDANDLTEFYHNLQQAKCSIRDISAERIRRTTLDPDASYHRRGYIENIDEFDYQFFNIPYGEAKHMDPHQRLLLEVVAEAIENCGYSLNEFNDTNTAVYVADKRLQYYEHADQFDPTLVTGNSSEFLAARINRVFNLKGGVAVIDTSCSSSLVALHNACNELRLGLADTALVCGVNLELFPAKNTQYQNHIEVESPDGFSIPFTAGSNGMVYGEAVICVVLKPLVKALQDNDHIQAVITGSAVNNNAARAASLTAPDSIAQSEVLRKAWASAGIEPRMLSFIEAHGSGTQLGDSLEIAGINLALEPYAQNGISIPISTVKSNIGHTRAAAGLAGFVKAVLAVKKKAMLPSVYNDPPNPHLQLKDAHVFIQRNAGPCKEEDAGKIMGGISSIGFSGTNCHVVIEQNQKALNGHHLATGIQPYLFLFSSWKAQELAGYIKRVEAFLSENTPGLADLSYTLGKGRDHYPYRKAFVATDLLELKDKLASYIHSGELAEEPAAAPKLIFIFSAGEHISYNIVESCCSMNRYFDERYRYYLEKVSLGMGRTAPQVFRFIFQLAYYDLLVHNGITTTTLLGIGTGQLIARVVRNELSVVEGLQKAFENKSEVHTETGLVEKLEKLLQSQLASQPAVFIEMGMGSNLYPLLVQHAENGRKFFVHQVPAVLPVLDIADLQAFLYHHHYAAANDFLNAIQARRIELPAHTFSKTRCWIREEPRKKSECKTAQAQQSDARQNTGTYINTVSAVIIGLWREILSLPADAVMNNFFEAGGDSINATKVIRRLNETFSIRLDFEDLFDYPSLEAFSALVSSKLNTTQRLMLIWKAVLGYENLQDTDNFFQKGGHSLLANQVLNRMKVEMKVKIDFEDFFLHPSVASMAAFLEQRNNDVQDDQIPVAATAEDYPVSHLQRRLWILGQMEESSVAYNEFNAFTLRGPLNISALKRAIETIIRRHEGFRTVFVSGAEGPRQKILEWSEIFDMQVEDKSDQSLSQQELTEQLGAFARQPFDLSRGPLLRTKLLRMENDHHIFLFNIHHIIFDEWSNRVFVRELAQLYSAYTIGQQISLQPLRVQYKDYAVWLQNNQVAKEAGEYWMNIFKDGAPALDLPTDLPRPPVKTHNGTAVTINIPGSVKNIIDSISAGNSASNFMTLTAITNLLFHFYSGQHTILLGTPVAGRKDVDMESCIGFFANTVVLKTEVRPEETFLQLLASVKKQVAGAFTHQLYPFDMLVEQLNIRADRSRMPLFDVMIGYQKNTAISNEGFEMQGVKVSAFGQPRETSKFDLSFDFLETANGLSLYITYNTDLFLPARIQRMGEHFIRLAEQLHTRKDQPLRTIDYRSAEDELDEQTMETLPASELKNPYSLFMDQVKERPSATAVYGNGWRITYEALHHQAMHLAACLKQQYKLGISEVVGIQLSHHKERIVAMLALSQLGASAAFIAADDNGHTLKYILTDGIKRTSVSEGTVYISWQEISSANTESPENVTDESIKARFSVGSSGKSIAITDLCNYIHWFNKNIPAAAGQQCWINTGVSVRWIENVWAALSNGLALLQRDTENTNIDTIATQHLNGLALTHHELQCTAHLLTEKAEQGLQWLIVDGHLVSEVTYKSFEEAGIVLKQVVRPSVDSPAVAEVINTVYPAQVKPLPGLLFCVTDQQNRPVATGISGMLRYRNTVEADWMSTGITFRRNGKYDFVLMAPQHEQYMHNAGRVSSAEILSALSARQNIGQMAVLPSASPADVLTAFIAPTKQRRVAERMLQNEAALPAQKKANSDDIALLSSFNATEKKSPFKDIVEYVSHWARITPGAIAASCGHSSLTYQRLNDASDNIARHLLLNDLRAEEIVPVFAERSLELLISMLGIMKAGAAYLPLGIDTPPGRIREILKDCGARMMLVNNKDQLNRFKREDISLIQKITEQFDISEWLSKPAVYDLSFIVIEPQSLAYVIYTSGSTGKPKGVMIEHGGMMNHLYAKIELLNIGIKTKVIQNAPQSFDISIWQFLSALVAGGQTIIYPDALIEDPAAFAKKLALDKPQILEVVPSYLNVLLDVLETERKISNWKPSYLLVTGEAFAPKLAWRWLETFPGVPLVNAYGPTEASDDITHYVFDSIDKELHRLPIGKPVRNMKIYIVNEAMELCAIGEHGEICVSGVGVGRGYLGQPEKTKEVFIDNPWQPGTRMYKTGDLGYFTKDGLVEFLGRKDHQVKIHGHRIETAEIEHCLCQLSEVQQAIVLPFKSADDNDFLAAWLLTSSTDTFKTETVKTFLREKLPPYMVPAYIFFRDRLPLTENGKIDRKAFPNPELFKRKKVFETEARQYLSRKLPEYKIPQLIAIDHIPLTEAGLPDWTMLQSMVWTEDAVQTATPVTSTEKTMAIIWQELLDLESIGIDDDFFEKGGHSLKAMRLLAAIEDKFGQRLSMRYLFATPTIRQLSAKLEQEKPVAAVQIPKQPEKEYYPASYAQRRMWVMNRLGDHGHAYNICGALQLDGQLNRSAWDDAWMQLIQRHEILRTGFRLIDEEVMQFILPKADASYSITQLDVSKYENPLDKLQAIHREHEQTVFNLEQPPLLRGSMICTAKNEYVFIYAMHHIIADEWSLYLLSKELLQLYAANLEEKRATLASLSIQYRDYSSWQRNQELAQWPGSRAYWQQKLKGPLPVLELPVDKARPAVKTYAGNTEKMLMQGISAQLTALGSASGATLFMMLVAGVKTFLHRYCQQDDIILGTPVAGRTHAQLQNSAGLYLNTLALRTAIKAEDSFYDVIRKVRNTTLEAFDHQDYPFDKLVEELEIKKDVSRSALFDVLLVQHDEVTETGPAKTGLLEVKPYNLPSTSSKFDLSFHFRNNGDDLEAGLNFNTTLFSTERAKLMIAHFYQLLSGLLADPSSSIQNINYTGILERRKLLTANPHNWQSPPDEDICTRMMKVWESKQQQRAAIDALGSLTFRELNEAADRMSFYLCEKHKVKCGQVIGLYMDRSIDMLVSMMAILKAGAAYLPMDKSFPAQRLDFMLQDSEAVLVISDEQWTANQPAVIWSESLRNELQSYPAKNAAHERTAHSIAYIIYTSGTSGKPKGVRITDNALINYAAGIETAYHLQGRKLRGLLASSIAFDLGYTSLWGMLLLGGELHLLPQTPYWQPRQVLEWIENEQINFIKLTPSHFRLLVHEIAQQPALQDAGEHLQWIVLGGEKPTPADMQLWLQQYPHCRIANHYGPTETTVGVLTQLISKDGDEEDEMRMADFSAQPVLGEPMGSHHVYITDRNGMLCGAGVWGELLIGGKGVTPGYVNRAELTEQKLIDNPFTATKEKLYRTGDRCRRLLNGKIEFSGRIDAQVQLKGYRIEPEEIENVLLQLKQIAQAAVQIATVHDEERLVAYVVSSQEDVIVEQDEVRTHIGKQLPVYMMPWKIIQLAVMPLTGNGKTDRNQLPDPSLFDAPLTEQARPAQNKAEEDLMAAFDSLMPGRNIQFSNNFFELGGDSIKAIQLASRLYGMGWKLDIKEVFDHPVLEDMAANMQVVKQMADQRPVEGEVLLSPIQYDFFQRGFLFEHHYNQSVLLKSHQHIDAKAVVQVVKKLFAHHDALRMVYLYDAGMVKQYNRGLEI